MTYHDKMMMYTITELAPGGSIILFESGASTDQGVMAAALRTITETKGIGSSLFTNGYDVSIHKLVGRVSGKLEKSQNDKPHTSSISK